jgi:uncharacterized protein YjbI with pentapeptide repeats
VGDGIKGNPYTREDVLRLIKENGGKAERLDLSAKRFEEGVDLSGLDLEGIILSKAHFGVLFKGKKPTGGRFDGSNLTNADLRNASLQYAQFKILDGKPSNLTNADLRGSLLMEASFQEADLTATKFGRLGNEDFGPATLKNTDLRGAKLSLTILKGCYFYGTKLEGAHIRSGEILEAYIEEADWGNYKIGEESEEDFNAAERVYRKLKVWYTQSGYADIAGKFYYREKEAQRKSLRFYYCEKQDGKKSLKLFPKNWRHRIALQLSYWFFGHGEGWKRIFLWIAGFVLCFALIYYAIGTLKPNGLLDSLYYSAVSFIALGYGAWVKEATGAIKILGVFETFLGFFMMTLLLVTFVRKWAR